MFPRAPDSILEPSRPDRPPTHPGVVFLEGFLSPVGITQKEAAKRLRISYPRMNEIVNGKRSVTPETALRLARFTRTDPRLWLDLQQAVDLWEARNAGDVEDILEIEPAFAPGGGPAAGELGTRSPRKRDRAERYAVTKVYPLGAEPPDELASEATAVERLAMVEALSEESWRIARSPAHDAGGRVVGSGLPERDRPVRDGGG